jgi:integrase
MPTLKLTAKTLSKCKLPAGSDDTIFWDEDLHGFGRRIHRSAGASWIIQYRTREGRSRRMTIAPGALPLGAARKSAVELLAKAKFSDPQGEKVTAREQAERYPLGRVIENFLEARQPHLRPSTYRQYSYMLRTYFKPLHSLYVNAPPLEARQAISRVLAQIERERGLRSAALSRQRLWTLYTWAAGEGLTDVNPVTGARRIEYAAKRDRVLSGEELIRVWHACDPQYFPRGGNFGRVIRLLILTGARRREIMGMRWSELDLKKGLWTLPAERSKNHRAHTLPLPPAALAIINETPHGRWDGRDIEDDGCVFSASGAMNVNRPLLPVLERCGFSDWWIHDIRRSVATGMAELGIQPHVIECVLNHQSGFRGGVAGVYNRSSYEREMAQALQRWSEHITALAEGRADKVVQLPQRSA